MASSSRADSEERERCFGVRIRSVIPVLAALVSVPCLGAGGIHMWANGPKLSSFALLASSALIPLGAWLLTTSSRRLRWVLGGTTAGLLLVLGVWALDRLAHASRPSDYLPYCFNGDCAASAPLPARLVAESETALAGLALARLLHLMTGNEGVSLERLLKKEYVALESSNILRGTPNGLLLESEAGGICYLRWVPLGLRRGPCLVFLHGFGGQLTVMVKALIEALPSPPVVILAPYLDTAGQWWLPEGQAVVRELVLHHLPPEADPKQVFLVGLSNGGVGASRLALSESLGPLFKGAILISGLAPPLEDPNNPKSVYEAPVHGADLLVIAGDADPRFPAPLVQSLVDATRRRGSLVELQRLEGDHFIMLSHRKQVGTMIRTWLEPRLLPSVSLGGPLPAEPPVIPRPAE